MNYHAFAEAEAHRAAPAELARRFPHGHRTVMRTVWQEGRKLDTLGLMLTRRTVLQLMAASGAALTAPELLTQTAANAAPALTPAGSGARLAPRAHLRDRRRT